jgi:hypothetical protein
VIRPIKDKKDILICASCGEILPSETGVVLDVKEMDEIQCAQWAVRDGTTKREKRRQFV